MTCIFPLILVHRALQLKVRDHLRHRGPVVAVVFSNKYDKPALTFCDQPQAFSHSRRTQ